MIKRKIIRIIGCIYIISSVFFSCKKKIDSNNNNSCLTSLGIALNSPYTNPIWHPNGKIIGFNHTPINSINFGTANKCYIDAIYTYKSDSTGFWLINADGTNQRRILPYILNTPSWSTDGKWLAFSKGGQIFKIPFDGQKLDTTAIVQLTFSGNNFSPSWNYQNDKIIYSESVCNGLNSCGVWLYDGGNMSLSNQFLVSYGQNPSWYHKSDFFLYNTSYYPVANGSKSGDTIWVYSQNTHQKQFLKLISNPYVDNRLFQTSADDSKIAFTAQSNISSGGIQICTINSDGSNFQQLTTSGAPDFSWAPDGRIVYESFDNNTIDQNHAVLWIMNMDGSNKIQLTFNRYIQINP